MLSAAPATGVRAQHEFRPFALRRRSDYCAETGTMGLAIFDVKLQHAGARGAFRGKVLTTIGAWSERHTRDFTPWSSLLGAARSGLAIATALTLACNRAVDLFPRGPAALLEAPYCMGARRFSPFCFTTFQYLDAVRCLCVVLLMIVASGYRPRITALFHAWISVGFAVVSPVINGGDQVTAILTLLLLPICFADPRRWHWQRASMALSVGPNARVVAWTALLLIRLQVAIIYFHAALGKTANRDWVNGTALYYWVQHPLVGSAMPVKSALLSLLSNGTLLGISTWSVIALEFLLGFALFFARPFQLALLIGGVLLHVGIAIVHGLPSFGLAMMAALTLYLGNFREPKWDTSHA